MVQQKEDFENMVREMIEMADIGASNITITARIVHEEMERKYDWAEQNKYPKSKNRIPMCCNAMRNVMRERGGEPSAGKDSPYFAITYDLTER